MKLRWNTPPRAALRDVLAVLLILAAAAFLRFYDIAARPLHSDEGVNFHFIRETLSRGYYPYSHVNYHGPVYFYLTTFFVALFGESEMALRGASLFTGMLLVLAPLLLRRELGKTVSVLSMLFIALSPGMVFHSRYAIHEMTFLLLSCILGMACFLWTLNGMARWIYAAAVSLALLAGTKETFVVTVAWIAAATLCQLSPKETWRRLYQQRRTLFWAALTCVVTLLGAYSGGFRWSGGILEMLAGFPQWLGRGTSEDVGHFKPFVYYLKSVIWQIEPLTLLVLLIGTVIGFAGDLFGGAKARWCIFLVIWTAGVGITYSFVPYKTPWLVINITLPLLLLNAAVISVFFQFTRPARVTGGLFAAASAAALLWSTIVYNYSPGSIFSRIVNVYPYGEHNPYSYVHTSPGMLQLLDDIRSYRQGTPGAKILIAVGSYWPLPYYLRAEAPDVAYLRTDTFDAHKGNYDIIVAPHTTEWQSDEFERRYYRMSDVEESRTFYRKRNP